MDARSLQSAASWVVWYDYFSIPQPDGPVTEPGERARVRAKLAKAVYSLPYYVSSCAMFFVLAPTVRHDDGYIVDYTSWKSRGWCRLERISRLLSHEPHPTILQVTRADTVFEIGAHEYLVEPVGLGEFSDKRDRLSSIWGFMVAGQPWGWPTERRSGGTLASQVGGVVGASGVAHDASAGVLRRQAAEMAARLAGERQRPEESDLRVRSLVQSALRDLVSGHYRCPLRPPCRRLLAPLPQG